MSTEVSNEELPNRIADLEESLSALLDHVEKLTDQVAGLRGPGGARETVPWLHTDPPAMLTQGVPVDATDDVSLEDEQLSAWVEWLALAYQPVQPAHKLPACWAEHPGLRAELLTLFHVWQTAFLDPQAAPDAAQNWHDRWLPGFLSRMPNWAPGSCLNGKHK